MQSPLVLGSFLPLKVQKVTVHLVLTKNALMAFAPTEACSYMSCTRNYI